MPEYKIQCFLGDGLLIIHEVESSGVQELAQKDDDKVWHLRVEENCVRDQLDRKEVHEDWED